MDWQNGKPNARFWVLKLLKDNFGKGDKLVSTHSNIPGVVIQAFMTSSGNKLLLINKEQQEVQIQLPDKAKGGSFTYVDTTTGENPPIKMNLTSNTVNLNGFSVAVIDFPE